MGRSIRVRLAAGDVRGFLRVENPDAGRVSRSRARPKGCRAVLVRCLLCGTVKRVAVSSLRPGGTVSCGCYRASGVTFGRTGG